MSTLLNNPLLFLPSKKARIAFIKEKLKSDDRWILRGLMAIYKKQTVEEKMLLESTENNGLGFDKFDAEELTKMSIQLLADQKFFDNIKNPNIKISILDFLHPRQSVILKRRIGRYASQLLKIAEADTPILKLSKRKLAAQLAVIKAAEAYQLAKDGEL